MNIDNNKVLILKFLKELILSPLRRLKSLHFYDSLFGSGPRGGLEGTSPANAEVILT